MSQKNRSNKVPSYYLYGLGTILIWSSTFSFTKVCLEVFSIMILSLLRFTVAGLFLFVISILKGIGFPERKDIPWFIFAAAVGFSVYMPVFNKGMGLLTSASACLIILTSPVISGIIARVLFGEKIRIGGWFGMGICFAGVLILFLWNEYMSVNIGILWMLIAAFFLSSYTIIQRKLTKKYTAFQSTSYSIIIASVMLLLLIPFIDPGEIIHAAPKYWISILYLGIFGSALSYYFWSKALSLSDKTVKVTNLQFLQPVLSMLWGYLLVFEIPSLEIYLGTATILAGIILFIKSK